MRTFIVFLAVVTLSVPINAGQRFCFSKQCVAPIVHHQPIQKIVQPIVQKEEVQTQTTVVNNLVGIPVPVSYSRPIAEQGATVYGYSSVADVYGNIDMAVLYNQAARLTDQAQQLAGQAAMDHAALVQAEARNRSDVAKIIAHGQSAAEALRASGENAYARDDQQVQQRSFTFKITQDSNGNMKIEEVKQSNVEVSNEKTFDLVTDPAQSVSDLLTDKCLKCHNNTNAKGSLNLLVDLDARQQRSILDRVTTDDLDLRMPRNADGTAAQKLSQDEIDLLFKAMGN